MVIAKKHKPAREEKAGAHAKVTAGARSRKSGEQQPDEAMPADGGSTSSRHGDEPTRDGFRATPREDRAG